MNFRNKLLGAILVGTVAVSASAAQATNGSITFQNSSTISTAVDTSCNAYSGTTCPGDDTVNPFTSITVPVNSSVPGSQAWGLVGGYFKYEAVQHGALGPAYCEFHIKLESNGSARWSGTVTPFAKKDLVYPYSPACTYSNFSVNSTTGDWSVTLRMQ